jgi:hypothetical protein
MSTRIPGDHRAQRTQTAQSDHIHDDERPRHERTASGCHHPCECGIGDALESAEGVHLDPVRRVMEVQWGKGHPVIELAVVSLAGYDRNASWDTTPNVICSDDDERSDVPVPCDQDPRPGDERARDECDSRHPSGAVYSQGSRRQSCGVRHSDHSTGPWSCRSANRLTTTPMPVNLLGPV